MNYIDLHIHTKYTNGNGITEIESLVKRAKEYNMSYLAITDSASIQGFEEFNNICVKYKITPIFGCGFYFAPLGHGSNTTQHLVLIARNNIGLSNLYTLDSISKKNISKGKPRIDFKDLFLCFNGLYCLTGGLGGVFDKPYLIGDKDLAFKNLKQLKELFKEYLFIELQNNGIKNNKLMLEVIPEVARALKIKMVVTGGSFYLDSDDYKKCNDIRISNGNKKLSGKEYNFKSQKEMCLLFKNFPNELEVSFNIAESCKVNFNILEL